MDHTDQFQLDDDEPVAEGPDEPQLGGVEADPVRLAQRQKQIAFGKNTQAYQNYIKAVPKHKRKLRGKDAHPSTPDITLKASKRCWAGLVRKWRRSLHQYDDPAPEDPAGRQAEGTGVEDKGEAAPAAFDALPPLAAPGLLQLSPGPPQQQQQWGPQSVKPQKEQRHGSAARASPPGRHSNTTQQQSQKRERQHSPPGRRRDAHGRQHGHRAVEPSSSPYRGFGGRAQGQAQSGARVRDPLPSQSREPRSGWSRQAKGDGGSRSGGAGEPRSWNGQESGKPGRGWRQAAGEPAAAAGRLTPYKRPQETHGSSGGMQHHDTVSKRSRPGIEKKERSLEAASGLGGRGSSHSGSERAAGGQVAPKSWADQVDEAFGDWAE